MVTHARNWPSAFNPSKCTHTAVSSEHTHCEHAPGAVGSYCSSAQGAIGGSVPCSRAPQSWYWRWRECCSFTIPTFNPCWTWDSNPQPLDYKTDSLTIRPRLPLNHYKGNNNLFYPLNIPQTGRPSNNKALISINKKFLDYLLDV